MHLYLNNRRSEQPFELRLVLEKLSSHRNVGRYVAGIIGTHWFACGTSARRRNSGPIWTRDYNKDSIQMNIWKPFNTTLNAFKWNSHSRWDKQVFGYRALRTISTTEERKWDAIYMALSDCMHPTSYAGRSTDGKWKIPSPPLSRPTGTISLSWASDHFNHITRPKFLNFLSEHTLSWNIP